MSSYYQWTPPDARTKRKRKNRNVDSKFPVFEGRCSMDNSVTTVDGKALCLPCKDTVAVLEEHYTYNGIIRGSIHHSGQKYEEI